MSTNRDELPLNAESNKLRAAMCAALLALLSIACATYPKMSPGAPLEVKRGYWIVPTEFTQRGRQVDRGSVKEDLSKRKRSESAAGRASGFDIVARLTAVIAGTCLGFGLARAIDGHAGDKATTAALATGGVNLGLSVGFGLASEGSFATASATTTRAFAREQPMMTCPNRSD